MIPKADRPAFRPPSLASICVRMDGHMVGPLCRSAQSPSQTRPHITLCHAEVDKESPPVPVLFNAEVALLLNKQKKNYQEKGIRVPEYVHVAPRRVCRLLLGTVHPFVWDLSTCTHMPK